MQGTMAVQGESSSPPPPRARGVSRSAASSEPRGFAGAAAAATRPTPATMTAAPPPVHAAPGPRSPRSASAAKPRGTVRLSATVANVGDVSTTALAQSRSATTLSSRPLATTQPTSAGRATNGAAHAAPSQSAQYAPSGAAKSRPFHKPMNPNKSRASPPPATRATSVV